MSLVCIVSGGLDSVTLAYKARAMGIEIDSLVSFDYGQRHVRELESAALCAQNLGVHHRIVGLGAVLQGARSALTSDMAVPDGHYAAETMKDTIVPGRNLLMIAAAASYAIDRGAIDLGIAVHGGDHFIYPDCRPEFIRAADSAVQAGYGRRLWAPFLGFDKTWIADQAHQLGVPIAQTWSCYKGGDLHCGSCGTCQERRSAFIEAGIEDPTDYADTAPLTAAP